MELSWRLAFVMKEKKIIIQLATKHNLPLHTIEEIVFHQFKFVAEIMKEPGFQSIRLSYFGKFHANVKIL